MKKLLICGLVATLAACDSGTSSIEQLCIKTAEMEGAEITSEVKELCSCTQAYMDENFASDRIDKFVQVMEAAINEDESRAMELADPSLESLFEGYLTASIMCAAQAGMIQ